MSYRPFERVPSLCKIVLSSLLAVSLTHAGVQRLDLNGNGTSDIWELNFLQSEDGLEVNGRGELVDNWGTPFFFHQLSRTELEIHSAGLDRRMWTADDLVLK